MDELEFIIKDALIMCDQGGAPGFFNPTFNTTTKMHGLLVTTAMDAIPLQNIPSFMVCKITQKPCVPATVPLTWKDTWVTKLLSATQTKAQLEKTLGAVRDSLSTNSDTLFGSMMNELADQIDEQVNTLSAKGVETLIGKSTCPCSVGGTVYFMTSGQIPLPVDAMAEVQALQAQAQRTLDDNGYGDSVGEAGTLESMAPLWGPGRDFINDVQTGDGWGAVINAGFFVWDAVSIGVGVVTFGGGTAVMQGAKAGVKGAIKKGSQLISKQALKSLGRAAFSKLSKESLEKGLKETAEKLSKEVITGCFVPGTPVHTQDGIKKIEEIQIGDQVWAFDEDTKSIRLQQVTNTMQAEVDQTIKVVTVQETIETTLQHPFYTTNGWKDAGDLQAGDKLYTKDLETVTVKTTQFLYEPKKVYNFEVAHCHTYFVGRLALLVHNSCLNYLVKQAVEKISGDPNKIIHILQDKHGWHKLVPDKNWDDVSSIISNVMKNGTKEAYKSVSKKVLQIGDEVVEVTFKEIDGKIFISDAWVK